jgi:hypothetical protein
LEKLNCWPQVRIVGGIEIEQDLAAQADLVAAEADEVLAQQVVEVRQFASGRCVLPTAEGGLRAATWDRGAGGR